MTYFKNEFRRNFLVEISPPEKWGTPHNKTQEEMPENRPVDISQRVFFRTQRR